MYKIISIYGLAINPFFQHYTPTTTTISANIPSSAPSLTNSVNLERRLLFDVAKHVSVRWVLETLDRLWCIKVIETHLPNWAPWRRNMPFFEPWEAWQNKYWIITLDLEKGRPKNENKTNRLKTCGESFVWTFMVYCVYSTLRYLCICSTNHRVEPRKNEKRTTPMKFIRVLNF